MSVCSTGGLNFGWCFYWGKSISEKEEGRQSKALLLEIFRYIFLREKRVNAQIFAVNAAALSANSQYTRNQPIKAISQSPS